MVCLPQAELASSRLLRLGSLDNGKKPHVEGEGKRLARAVECVGPEDAKGWRARLLDGLGMHGGESWRQLGLRRAKIRFRSGEFIHLGLEIKHVVELVEFELVVQVG